MVAKVSVKGRMVIPKAIREQARIKAGDELDIGYSGGLIIMRKRRALTASLSQIPNALTVRTLNASRKGKGVKRFDRKKDLYTDLG